MWVVNMLVIIENANQRNAEAKESKKPKDSIHGQIKNTMQSDYVGGSLDKQRPTTT